MSFLHNGRVFAPGHRWSRAQLLAITPEKIMRLRDARAAPAMAGGSRIEDRARGTGGGGRAGSRVARAAQPVAAGSRGTRVAQPAAAGSRGAHAAAAGSRGAHDTVGSQGFDIPKYRGIPFWGPQIP